MLLSVTKFIDSLSPGTARDPEMSLSGRTKPVPLGADLQTQKKPSLVAFAPKVLPYVYPPSLLCFARSPS